MFAPKYSNLYPKYIFSVLFYICILPFYKPIKSEMCLYRLGEKTFKALIVGTILISNVYRIYIEQDHYNTPTLFVLRVIFEIIKLITQFVTIYQSIIHYKFWLQYKQILCGFRAVFKQLSKSYMYWYIPYTVAVLLIVCIIFLLLIVESLGVKHFVDFVDFMYMFSTFTSIAIFNKVIRHTYSQLNEFLTLNMNKEESLCTEYLVKVYNLLCKLMQIHNYIFGWKILLLILVASLGILEVVNFIIVVIKQKSVDETKCIFFGLFTCYWGVSINFV